MFDLSIHVIPAGYEQQGIRWRSMLDPKIQKIEVLTSVHKLNFFNVLFLIDGL